MASGGGAAEDDGLAGLHASSSEGAEYHKRSVNLFADPKMRELKHYTKSHTHEQRLRANAELERRPRGSQVNPTNEAMVALTAALRTDGCDVVNQHVKRLAVTQEATLQAPAPMPTTPSMSAALSRPDSLREEILSDQDPQSPEDREALLRRMNRFQTRLQWRDHMDKSLTSLMADIELASNDRLKEYAHKARCDHLDKIYDWYLTHGMKEARKERAAPPYVRFSVDGPVMPGSMRVSRGGLSRPSTTSRRDSSKGSQGGSMQHSVSLPTLGPGKPPSTPG